MLLRPLRRFFATTAATTTTKKQKAPRSTAQQQEAVQQKEVPHGRLYTWGYAFYGRLAGTFASGSINQDVPVLLDEIKDVTRVQSGFHHLLVQTCIIVLKCSQ